MADGGPNGAERARRRWSFADCIFDEANWTLTVGGRRVPIEPKPLELLRELLLQAGNLVTKDDLLNAIWRDVMVVEASLPTAVHKLRGALNDDQRPTQLIETVPRIGYRFSGSVEVEDLAGSANGAITTISPAANGREPPMETTAAPARRGRRRLLAAGVLALGIGAVAIPLTSSREVPAAKAAPSFSKRDAQSAIRRLDVAAIERLLAAGWDPNAEVRDSGSAALHYAVEMCEWNPVHDRDRLVLMVRTLQEGGGRLDLRNVWGDTPYSIAREPRYCGPNHPVTRSIRATCTFHGVIADYCLASYEIARRTRRRGG